MPRPFTRRSRDPALRGQHECALPPGRRTRV